MQEEKKAFKENIPDTDKQLQEKKQNNNNNHNNSEKKHLI